MTRRDGVVRTRTRGRHKGEKYPIRSRNITKHPITVASGDYWRRRYFELFTEPPPYEDYDNLRYIPEDKWQYSYYLEETGEGRKNALRYIDPTTTNTPTFDNAMDNPLYFISRKGLTFDIVWMSPDQYFRECAKNREEHGWENPSASRERQAVDDDRAREYANLMESGIYFPMPNIDKDYGQQEGRHRARALEMLGVELFPVFIFRKVTKSEDSPPRFLKSGRPNPEYDVWEREMEKKLGRTG